jgi:hypothetical protein
MTTKRWHLIWRPKYSASFKELIDGSSPQEAVHIVGVLYSNLLDNFFKGDIDEELARFCGDVKHFLAEVAQADKPKVVS